jgi:hypothetical protein
LPCHRGAEALVDAAQTLGAHDGDGAGEEAL